MIGLPARQVGVKVNHAWLPRDHVPWLQRKLRHQKAWTHSRASIRQLHRLAAFDVKSPLMKVAFG